LPGLQSRGDPGPAADHSAVQRARLVQGYERGAAPVEVRRLRIERCEVRPRLWGLRAQPGLDNELPSRKVQRDALGFTARFS
jgi:hypothetical protein